jgi:hypothetical protein
MHVIIFFYNSKFAKEKGEKTNRKLKIEQNKPHKKPG